MNTLDNSMPLGTEGNFQELIGVIYKIYTTNTILNGERLSASPYDQEKDQGIVLISFIQHCSRGSIHGK
jgi:hypothetical protein